MAGIGVFMDHCAPADTGQDLPGCAVVDHGIRSAEQDQDRGSTAHCRCLRRKQFGQKPQVVATDRKGIGPHDGVQVWVAREIPSTLMGRKDRSPGIRTDPHLSARRWAGLSAT